MALLQQRAISISTRHLSASVGANGKSLARARRRPCPHCYAVSRAEKLGEVDTLRQYRIIVAGAHETRNYFTRVRCEREINEQLELGMELFGDSPKERGRSEIAFNVGGHGSSPSVSTCSFPGSRHRRRYTREGIRRIAVAYEMNAN